MNEKTNGRNREVRVPNWHAMEADEVLSSLDVDEKGLSKEEARERLEAYGPNKLPEEEKAGPVRRFFSQFKNVLIYVLIVAAIFAAVLGHWVDAAVIAAVVLINALIGFLQEGKAERAMESIRGMLSANATVLRDGQEREVPAEELVPGDIVVLRSGDRVPADIRILGARNAQVEEAALTGESEPADKQADPVEEDAVLGDRKCMAYSGTMVTGGKLRGVVAATGGRAEIGRIGEMVSKVERLTTPLIRKIDAFGHRLSVFIVILSAGLFAFGYFIRGFSPTEMFMAVVGLAVAAIPEGLPAIMTITLALGVQRMARRNAIIRRLPAVETLGSVTVICSDKTGTLTRNEMTVKKVAAADKVYSVGGVGYEPEGEFSVDGEDGVEISPQDDPFLTELLRAGLLASEARLYRENGNWKIEGLPTEASVVVLARKAGMTREKELEIRPMIDMIPFESARRFMASLHEDPEGENVVYIKGAPERLLEMCSRQCMQQGDRPLDRDDWLQREKDLADGGHRVLAMAKGRARVSGTFEEDSIKDLVLLGMVGIMDPPREEAIEAIKECREAGIQVKMITGDHVLTARSIGASMGIGDGRSAVTGKEMEKADERELIRLVEGNDVFARSSPEHKLRIMEALQSRGQIVAMTGDGVNDAPALKRADVGVAMGIKGSEAAKEAAEMVLADDNFASIEKAVEEGRTIYDNLTKTILFILPTNGAEALVIVSSVLFLFDVMPITPLQILWVNMITAVTLAISLAFEPPEKGIMRRPPRDPEKPIISKYLLWRIAFVSVLIATASILLFMHLGDRSNSIEQARTVAVNTLVAGQLFYLFNSRFIHVSSLSARGLAGNGKALVAAGVLVLFQLGFTYLEPIQNLFGTASLTAVEWGWIMTAGLAIFLLVEAEKALVRGRGERDARTRKPQERPERPEKPERTRPPEASERRVAFQDYRTTFERETAQASEELRRPAVGLFFSGLVAGSCVGLTVFMLGILLAHAGGGIDGLLRSTIAACAYAAGFAIIVMSRAELFTGYTTMTVVPLLTGKASLSSVIRHWSIVFFANLLGAAAFAMLASEVGSSLGIVRTEVYTERASSLVGLPWQAILSSAFLAGWLVGLIYWLAIATRESIGRIFFVLLVAGIIGFAHLHHSIMGGAEVFLGTIGSDEIVPAQLGRFMLWATLGNILGSLAFAVLIRYAFSPRNEFR